MLKNINIGIDISVKRTIMLRTASGRIAAAPKMALIKRSNPGMLAMAMAIDEIFNRFLLFSICSLSTGSISFGVAFSNFSDHL